MKKWIFVFIAMAGSIYSFYSSSFDCEKLSCSPELAQKPKEKNIQKKIITYKNIKIHTPVVKDTDKLEIIGIDKKSMPVVYYKYDNSIKTASINETIENKFKILEVNNNSVLIEHKKNNIKETFDIK